ncbi:MAG TPA: helix-turn-helix domain-containing protein [Steroidobacteraceae bacterium]|nr:helix-turn-helix domain-containing protein [Steroidobacteraceae bacterium]
MSYIAVRREEEKERRRAEIVDAAEELYAELGWDAVTMENVAKTARLSRALIYVYFRDKSDLLHAITERALLELRERFVAAAARHPLGLDKVQAIGRAYVLFQQEKPYRFDACSRFHAHQSANEEPTEAACAAAGDAVIAVIVQALIEGQADGSIRRDLGNPAQVCVMLWAFTHGLIQIGNNKKQEIARLGIEVSQLMEGSFAMLRYMLIAQPAR